MFRTPARGNGRGGPNISSDDHVGAVGFDPESDGATAGDEALEPGNGHTPGNGHDSGNGDPPQEAGFLSAMRRRRPSSALIAERYERVGQLLGSLRDHFEQQDRRSKELSDAVARMADVLEQLPETQRAQGETMQAIAAHLQTGNRQSSELRETLVRVPSAIQAQADAIQAVSRQLGVSSNADSQLVGSLQRLSRVVNGLGISNREQIETLQRMHADSIEQRDGLASVIREQSRRYLMIVAGAGVVTLTAIISLLVMLTR
jgi:methyl-accepting chemotaxis protein